MHQGLKKPLLFWKARTFSVCYPNKAAWAACSAFVTGGSLGASVELWYRPVNREGAGALNGQQTKFSLSLFLARQHRCLWFGGSRKQRKKLGSVAGSCWAFGKVPNCLDRQLEVLVHSPFLSRPSFPLEVKVEVEPCCFPRAIAVGRSIFLLQTLCPWGSCAGICSVE